MKTIKTPIGEMTVRNHFDEEVIKEVIIDLEYERWGEITINEGDTVIDCGAHIGSFTRLALANKANVIAIEPEEKNFELLKINTEGQENLKLVNVLLWTGKDVAFKVDPKRGELNKIDGDGVMQPSVKLDDLITKFKVEKIDLLKMDIEGAEYEVLYNFKHLKLVEQLTMEWHYGSSNLAKLILFLEKNGLTVVWLGGNGDWGKLQAKRK